MNFFQKVVRFIHDPRPAIQWRYDVVRDKLGTIKGNHKTKLTEEYPQLSMAENNVTFFNNTTDIKVIALYLPQFHEFEENNKWWGQGFTEWTNVKKGQPHYVGHNQPRIPHDDFGYYDLSTEEAVRKQVELANEHGIYAFGMYYYWFSGHRLMEKPMDILFENKDLCINYFAIWANENFTRAWDGQEKDILLKQEYATKDPYLFIESLAKYIEDERYMRVDGKPVIGIYNPGEMENAAEVFRKWRDYARELGIGEIEIWACITDQNQEDMDFFPLIDEEYEFPPRGKEYVSGEHIPHKSFADDYIALIESERRFPVEPLNSLHPYFRCTMMEWDNSARRSKGFLTWKNYSPFRFYVWNRIAMSYLRANYDLSHRYLFINAWNEWGEGTYLEPDKKLGYANINALSKAIFNMPYSKQNSEIIEYMGSYREPNAQSKKLLSSLKIAVQAHMYYDDLAIEFAGYLLNMPCLFDLYITTDTEEKAIHLESLMSGLPTVNHLEVSVAKNQGRDVLPFLNQMKEVANNYDLICHIHTKKTPYEKHGEGWRKYLLQNLLGSEDLIADIFNAVIADDKLGLVFPQTYFVVKDYVEWGSNKNIAEDVATQLDLDINLPDDPLFPAGDMFWARPQAIQQLLSLDYSALYREEDDNKVDGTVMHAIERLWVYIAEANGYHYLCTRNLLDDFELAELKYPTC